MTAEPTAIYPTLSPNMRVVVIAGSASDCPRYKACTAANRQGAAQESRSVIGCHRREKPFWLSSLFGA